MLTMMGSSATFHISTSNIATATAMGSTHAIYMFDVEASYNVPPVSMTLNGQGPDLESACGEIAWQFLERIGMHAE